MAGATKLLLASAACAAGAAQSDADGPPEKFVKLAGASWEFTDCFDCWKHDLATHPVKVWGTAGAVDDREHCAQKCLELDDCVAFNFPSPRFPAPDRPYDPQVCYLKRAAMNSEKTGVHCIKAFDTEIWQYYSLTDSNIWARMAKGFEALKFPFFRPLEVDDQSVISWVGGVRWETAAARDCHGGDLSSVPVDASGDYEGQRQACAERCLSAEDCMGFDFPNFSGGKAWDESVAGGAACTLKTFEQRSVTSMALCSEKKDPNWTFHALADAWHTRMDEGHVLRRIRPMDAWDGPALGTCDSTPDHGKWLKAGSKDERLEKAEGPGCCKFIVNHCGANTSEDCKPYIAHPPGCTGVCKTPLTACTCWTQKDVVSDGECCTKCDVDCKGGSTCFPATCGGPTKMCNSKKQIGDGSVCSCAAQGLDPWHDVVPADVAAGWRPSDQIWG